MNVTQAFGGQGGQGEDRPPAAGDYTVCFHCAAILRVTDGDGRVAVDQEEFRRLVRSDPELAAHLRIVSGLVIRADVEARRQMWARNAARKN